MASTPNVTGNSTGNIAGKLADFAIDFKASIVVFLVALPLCLGIAVASGAPAFTGLISGIIGGIVVGAFSDSRISVSGPAAGLTVVVFSSIEQLGSYQAFAMAVVVGGVIQIALGVIKGGNIGDYFPSSVISGMMAAIGIILVYRQISPLIGIDHQVTLYEVFHLGALADAINLGGAIIGVLSMGALFAWQWFTAKGFAFAKILPGGLFVVALGIVLGLAFEGVPALALERSHMINLNIGDGGWDAVFGKFTYPDWSVLASSEVYTVGLTLAIITSLATLLCLDATDTMDPERRVSSKNQELVAQGIGNSVAGLVGGLPIASVIVRSSANAAAGAKSRASTIMHGVWLVLCVVFIAGTIERIPLACLAAMLITVGMGLSPWGLYKNMYELGKVQFLPFIATVVVILTVNLLVGVGVGMAISIFFMIRNNINSSITLVSEKDNYIIRFVKDSSFLNKPLLKGILVSIPDNSRVAFDSLAPIAVDRDIILIFEGFLSDCKERNISVSFKNDQLKITFLSELKKLFVQEQQDADYFSEVSDTDKPTTLLISCSDSRVNPAKMSGIPLTEMHSHANIANQINATNKETMKELEYAVNVLEVERIIVCGHTYCSGLMAAMTYDGYVPDGVGDRLQPLRDLYNENQADLPKDDLEKSQRIIGELNVRRQVDNLAELELIQNLWKAGKGPSIHGWIFYTEKSSAEETYVRNRPG